MGPDTTLSDAASALTVAAAKRPGDLHHHAQRAQQQQHHQHQHWKVEAGVSDAGGGGGSAEVGGVDNVVLRASLEVTLPVAGATAAGGCGSTSSGDGQRSVESCDTVGGEGDDDDRSGKGMSGARILPSLRSRGSVSFAHVEGGLEEDVGRSGSGGSLETKDGAIGNGGGADVCHPGTTHTPPAELQASETL